MQTVTTQQVAMFNQFETVGFNSIEGHFGITESGERVQISKEDFDSINFLADQFFAQADDFNNWVEAHEADFGDLADWQAAQVFGFTFS